MRLSQKSAKTAVVAGISVALSAAWATSDGTGPTFGWHLELPICSALASRPELRFVPGQPATVTPAPELAFGEGFKLFKVSALICPDAPLPALPSSRVGSRHATDFLSGRPETVFELPVTAPRDASSDGRLRAQSTFQLLIPKPLTLLLNRTGAAIPSGVISLILSSRSPDGAWRELGRHTEPLLRGEALTYTWAIETPAVPAGTPLKLSLVLHFADAPDVMEMLPPALLQKRDELSPILVLRDARLSGTAHFSTNQPIVNP